MSLKTQIAVNLDFYEDLFGLPPKLPPKRLMVRPQSKRDLSNALKYFVQMLYCKNTKTPFVPIATYIRMSYLNDDQMGSILAWLKLANSDYEDMTLVRWPNNCIMLGKFEDYLNGYALDLNPATPTEITELVEMVKILPMLEFYRHRVIFTPTFGASSLQVGGANAHFVSDDKLILISMSKKMQLDKPTYYEILSLYDLYKESGIDGFSGEINKLGVYFPRFGYMYDMDV